MAVALIILISFIFFKIFPDFKFQLKVAYFFNRINSIISKSKFANGCCGREFCVPFKNDVQRKDKTNT